MSRPDPTPGDLVICETAAAISTHFRIVTDARPFKPAGHRSPQPETFCERPAAWDTLLPTHRQDGHLAAGCAACLVEAQRRGIGVVPPDIADRVASIMAKVAKR